MNISYYRKSKHTLENTLNNLKKNAKIKGYNIAGESILKGAKGALLFIENKSWLNTILDNNEKLVGFLPVTIAVIQKTEGVMVGTGKPSIMGSLTADTVIQGIAQEAESALTELINESAGVGELKPKKVKLYATETCPYCKMENAWLKEKNIEHEYILVDRDKAAAKEMVEKTGQMGVPVTEVLYEDSDADIIVGFDRQKLEEILRIKS